MSCAVKTHRFPDASRNVTTYCMTQQRKPTLCLPQVALIGQRKGGTSALWGYLVSFTPPCWLSRPLRLPLTRPAPVPRPFFQALHPNVSVASTKELQYYDQPLDRLNRYLSHARPAAPDRIIVDATPAYALIPSAMERMARWTPETRIVYIVRDPVDRYESSLRHEKARSPGAWAERQGVKWAVKHLEAELEHAARCMDLTRASRSVDTMDGPVPMPVLRWGNASDTECYPDGVEDRFEVDKHRGKPTVSSDRRSTLMFGVAYPQLVRVLQLFPRNQVKVVRYERLKSDPKAVMKDLYGFLGLSPYELSGSDEELRGRVDALLYDGVMTASWKRASKASAAKAEPPVQLPEESRKALRKFMEPFNAQLTALLGPSLRIIEDAGVIAGIVAT